LALASLTHSWLCFVFLAGVPATAIELGEIPSLLLLIMLLILLSKLLWGSEIKSKSTMGVAPLLNSMAVSRRGAPLNVCRAGLFA
jgi:hypothetical protein